MDLHQTGRASTWLGLFLGSLLSLSAAEVILSSPGFATSRMDAQGRLVEDWGSIAIKVDGKTASQPTVRALKLEGVIPAAECQWQEGAVDVTLNAFRAPAWPAGMDVLTVGLRTTTNSEVSTVVSLDLPGSVRIGARTAGIGGRTVLSLPPRAELSQETREWGWDDDAVPIRGWGKPSVPCDESFKNIRAGLGGVPILYRFKVSPKAGYTVVLGFCESHWPQPGARPLLAQVEGADPQGIDPVAAWGQHKPGALQFSARDQNGDGRLEIAVVTAAGAPDENPILNAIWIFAPTARLDLQQVISGGKNSTAKYYVDVGGPNDQSLFAGGNLEYKVDLSPGTTRTLTFLVASPGGAVPPPDASAWTLDKLRQSAAAVWREWVER